MSDLLLNAVVKAGITKDRAVNKVQTALASERGDLIQFLLVAVFVVGLLSFVFIRFLMPVIKGQAEKTSTCIAQASQTVCSGF